MIQLACVLFMFMAAIDISVLATIIPYIIASLGEMHLYPVMSATFLFAFVLATPVTGMIADHYGSKRASCYALSLFLAGSLLCGLSLSMKWLILFRFVQGLGAAGLTNICFVIIARQYETDAQRSIMQATLSAVWAIASIFGPLIGAFLTELISWRAVFFMNIPVCLVAGYALMRFQEKPRLTEEKFDYRGMILFSTAALLLFISTSEMADLGVSLMPTLFCTLGAILFVFFVIDALKSETPLIPLRLLKHRGIFICIVLAFISGACVTWATTLLSLYLQGAMRASLQNTGFVIAAMSIGWAIGSFACGLLVKVWSVGRVCVVAMLLLSLGFCLLAGSTVQFGLTFFLVTSVLVGIGLGAIVNGTNTGVMRASHQSMVGRATSFVGLVRSLGMSVGATVSGFLQLAHFHNYLKPAMDNGLPAAIGNLLLSSPEKLLSLDFADRINTQFFTTVCRLFGQSIETTFLWPAVILFIVSPLCIFISQDSNA